MNTMLQIHVMFAPICQIGRDCRAHVHSCRRKEPFAIECFADLVSEARRGFEVARSGLYQSNRCVMCIFPSISSARSRPALLVALLPLLLSFRARLSLLFLRHHVLKLRPQRLDRRELVSDLYPSSKPSAEKLIPLFVGRLRHHHAP